MKHSEVCNNRCARPAARRGAFTLVELLAVVVIIAMLAAILLRIVSYVSLRSTLNKVKADMEKIKTALEEYRIEYGGYPSTTNVVSGRPKFERFSYHHNSSNLAYFLFTKPLEDGKERPFIDPSLITYQTNLWFSSTVNNTDSYVKWEPGLEEKVRKDKYIHADSVLIVTNTTIVDPWGTDYRYYHERGAGGKINKGKYAYDLWSFGPDRKSAYNGCLVWESSQSSSRIYAGENQKDTFDDIKNWEEQP